MLALSLILASIVWHIDQSLFQRYGSEHIVIYIEDMEHRLKLCYFLYYYMYNYYLQVWKLNTVTAQNRLYAELSGLVNLFCTP